MSACFSAATGVFTLTPAGEKYLARCLSALAILGEAEDEISEQQTTLSGRQLTTQTSVLCAAPDYLAQAGTPADTGELMQHRCITGFRRDKPFYWSLYCDGQLLRIIQPPFYELADGDAMLAAVLGGHGIAQLPLWMIGDYLADGSLCRVLPVTAHRPRYIFSGRRRRSYRPEPVA